MPWKRDIVGEPDFFLDLDALRVHGNVHGSGNSAEKQKRERKRKGVKCQAHR